MKKRHQQYRQLIPRALYGELNEKERAELEEHLRVCQECRDESRSTNRLHVVLNSVPLSEINDTLLADARLQARAALGREHSDVTLWQQILNAIRLPIVYRPAVAVASLGLVVLGFFGGKILGLAAPTTSEVTPGLADGAHISNVRFVGGGETPGGVDVLFDAVKPVHLRGTIDDPVIRKVLSYALINEENPGVRLRTAGLVAATPISAGESEVKAALLRALQTDPNDGVRKEALKAVLRYPPDTEMRDALLHVLLSDTNPALRVAAVTALDSLRNRGHEPDLRTREVLRDHGQYDDNLFVRIKSRTLLEERSQ